jgi:hypothetical protein
MYPLASNAAGNDQRLLITNNTGKKPIHPEIICTWLYEK